MQLAQSLSKEIVFLRQNFLKTIPSLPPSKMNSNVIESTGVSFDWNVEPEYYKRRSGSKSNPIAFIQGTPSVTLSIPVEENQVEAVLRRKVRLADEKAQNSFQVRVEVEDRVCYFLLDSIKEQVELCLHNVSFQCDHKTFCIDVGIKNTGEISESPYFTIRSHSTPENKKKRKSDTVSSSVTKRAHVNSSWPKVP